MKSRTYQILKRILKYCGQVEETNETFGRSFYAFSENFIYRNAVCMCVLQISELAKLLPMDFRKEYPQVPWREWCGVRTRSFLAIHIVMTRAMCSPGKMGTATIRAICPIRSSAPLRCSAGRSFRSTSSATRAHRS